MVDLTHNREGSIPAGTIEYIDSAVKDALSLWGKELQISPHGESHWSQTAKIVSKYDFVYEDNVLKRKQKRYFLKVIQGHRGLSMVHAVFATMCLLEDYAPGLVPKPLAWGSYQETADTHFFASEFRDMSTEKVPDVPKLARSIAEMHRGSQSSIGYFGFPMKTFNGISPQFLPPSGSWESCFSSAMRGLFETEMRAQGQDPEISQLAEQTLDKVIPGLLRSLAEPGNHAHSNQ